MSDFEQKRIFAENLNNILEERSKTQKEVADAIGVSPQTFNTWCQGIALPRMGKLQLLADYFLINKSELIEKRSSAASLATDPGEDKLVSIYRTLNSKGKDKLIDRAEELLELGYAKETSLDSKIG